MRDLQRLGSPSKGALDRHLHCDCPSDTQKTTRSTQQGPSAGVILRGTTTLRQTGFALQRFTRRTAPSWLPTSPETPRTHLRRLLSIFALITMVLASQPSTAAEDLTEESGRKLAESLAKVFTTGDMKLAVATFDPLIRMRSPVLPQEAVGIQNVAGFIATNLSAFPDLRVHINEVLVSGDRMAVTFQISGTHRGALGELMPTGRAFSADGMAWAKVENGKILEWRDHWNALDLYAALGLTLAPPNAEPSTGAPPTVSKPPGSR